MTFTANLSLPQAEARRLADVIGEDEALGWPVVDAAEKPDGRWSVAVYFEAVPDRNAQQRLAALAKDVLGQKAPAFEITELPKTDWVARSLEGLRPVRAGRFLVHGAHDRALRVSNLINIEIEAGLAFGTGHHGTTAGCLTAIDRLGHARRFHSILDLGTGSGVLAIAMAKAWGRSVLATDIDPQAVRVATANAKANGVWNRLEAVTAKGFEHPAFARRAPFDLIVANILAKPLASLSRDLAEHLAPSGVVILSGLLPGQRAEIVAAYRDKGLRLISASIRDGWLTLILEKRRQK